MPISNTIRSTAQDAFFQRPLDHAVGQPLRVSVYTRLAEGIRRGVFALGEMLPRETELSMMLGVSRTPVREALMLLEEDGLLTTRRGVGRFVTDSIPRNGLELLRPFEVALAESGRELDVQPIRFELEGTTDFVSNRLALDSTANAWIRESVLTLDDAPVAAVQEHLPAGRYLSDISPRLFAELTEIAAEPRTVLAAMNARGITVGNGVVQIVATDAGPTRSKILGVTPKTPVLVLTQSAELGGVPLYAAKCVVAPGYGALSVMQNNPN
ncbi:GntR family transcriptional regulator [Curtobacterium flaccumfaciens]|jgi:GntR family transcriptional regulator|uniref:GntR family transcriptional regulator n=1 Tax=Curtobacterium flaccumfaciens TaxID=2035 RepID=UPI00188D9EEF|nr:GntR family transcriptional regulator [Curtobacterium flaccumfaciens]MBF4595727.1 GntR family transcriptional regulator [Curtobacterium flaccumfaciens]